MYLYAIIAAAAFIAGGAAAWNVQTWRHDSAQLAAQENQREVDRMKRQAANSAAAKHEADKVQIRKVFVPITQEVERVITQIEYRDRACLSPDSLRAAQNAIARANGDTGESSGTVPPAAKPE